MASVLHALQSGVHRTPPCVEPPRCETAEFASPITINPNLVSTVNEGDAYESPDYEPALYKALAEKPGQPNVFDFEKDQTSVSKARLHGKESNLLAIVVRIVTPEY